MAAKCFSEASSSGFQWKHEVFLSFRGEDTRKNFTDHLYTALVNAGVFTFRDDNELPRGNDISSELLKAIEESKISVVVFSKSYASSRWCLDELVKIIDCRNTTGQIVFPIFYDVDPSDVRKQVGSFADSFSKHEQRFKDQKERIEKWREALTVAGNLSGYDLRSMSNGYESRSIQKIVHYVLGKLNRNIRYGLHVATHPVALESRVKRVMKLLRTGSEKVRIVGIYGMSGIGKTTIAKAVYNMVCQGFEGFSFLSNIKDESHQPNGLAGKQEQLLSDILSWKNTKIDNIDRGINLIKERLCCRTVFIVLDDLDESAQWRALVGDRNWFGPGSRILVTTRNEHLLTELEVDERYNVELLNPEESIELPAPAEDYLQLSNSLVKHAQGLPLALEILGSYLFKRSQPEWESFTEKLRKVPHHEIHKKLRMSTYDTLDDDFLKAMFLDIACFYIGMDKDYVMTILDGCGFFPKIGFQVLLERSIIAIEPRDQKLKMHDLLRDMGREIVREESVSHPGYRSRLWIQQDVVDILTKHMGMEAVEGLSLDVPALKDVISTEAFAKMIKLRLLKIDSVYFTGSYEKFSKELRWLFWRGCPLAVLPPNLHLDNLAVLDMRFSNIKKVWKETKVIKISLHKLKILDLSYSVYLGETPNFARLSSLERLELEGCTALVEIDQSIGHLERLELLNLAKCKNIRELPDSICNLRSLATMNLHCCSKLCRLPEHLGKLEALRELVVSGSAIAELPTSIGLLKNLAYLSLAREELPCSKSWFSFFSPWISPKSSAGSSSLLLPATFHHLSSLRKLNLRECSLSEKEISFDFGKFPLLMSLDLGGNKFCNLPAGISNHPRLEYLMLNNCKNLRSITELPKNLWGLEANQCTSIERYPNLSNLSPRVCEIYISNCRETVDMQGWDFRSFRPWKTWDWLASDPTQPKKWFRSKWRHLEAYFPARKVPDWFEYKQVGSSVLFFMPSDRRAMVLCAIYSVNEECNDESTSAASLTIYFKNKTKGCETFDWSRWSFDGETCKDHAWVTYYESTVFLGDINAEEGDEIEVSIEPRGGILVKKCGIHLPTDEYGTYTSTKKYHNRHIKSSICVGCSSQPTHKVEHMRWL
ncbi:hypothetical protein PTKIN_Ptkin09bG0240100 [Pterospermum kingtungense]